MKKSDISSTVVFPKLRIILKEDVEVLRNMKKDKDGNMVELLDSLISAKNRILGLFPENSEGIGGSPTPPQRLHLEGYDSKTNHDHSNLISILHKIETDQMNFVKKNVSDEGMPKDLSNTLYKILEIYSNITEQLGRSKKTNQYNAIVL